MNKKLSLNKEVIATLNNDSMNQLQGGQTYTITCTQYAPACTDSAECTNKWCYSNVDSLCVCRRPYDMPIITEL